MATRAYNKRERAYERLLGRTQRRKQNNGDKDT